MSLRTLRSSTLRATRAISTPGLNPAGEPVQVDVRDPLQAVLDAPPGHLDRLAVGPAGTEPERGPGERPAEGRGRARPGGGRQDRPPVRGPGGGGGDGAGWPAGGRGAVAGAGPAVVPAAGRDRDPAGVLAGDRSSS